VGLECISRKRRKGKFAKSPQNSGTFSLSGLTFVKIGVFVAFLLFIADFKFTILD